MATTKHFAQIILTETTNPMPSPTTNLIETYGGITALGIHALPGTKFSITGLANETFQIGPNGNLCLDCFENPITQLYLISYTDFNEKLMYPIIIDIEYLQ